MSQAPATVADYFETDGRTALPLVFLNRKGVPEPRDATFGEINEPLRFGAEPEGVALRQLERALLETGQLIVMPDDGLARVCFTGIGDTEQLLVEVLPAEGPMPVLDFDAPAQLCSLAQAASLLRRLYRGGTSGELAEFLNGTPGGGMRGEGAPFQLSSHEP